MEITFLTSNQDKIKEAREILGEAIRLNFQKVDLDEVQEIDGAKVVIKKANDAFRLIKKPLLVEDTSLYIVPWKGLPGALIKWFLKTVNNEGIINMLQNSKKRDAIAHTVVAYHDGKNIRIFEGSTTGLISKKVAGENGFGWDKIFIPKGFNKTQAEMSSEEKSKISSRKTALEKLKNFLQQK